jgi:hypothetical protein
MWDWLKPSPAKRLKNLPLIITERHAFLLGSCSFAQIIVAALRASDMRSCGAHQSGALVFRKGATSGRVAIKAAIQRFSPDFPVRTGKRLAAVKAYFGDVGTAIIDSWHAENGNTPNGSLAVSPLLVSPLGAA